MINTLYQRSHFKHNERENEGENERDRKRKWKRKRTWVLCLPFAPPQLQSPENIVSIIIFIFSVIFIKIIVITTIIIATMVITNVVITSMVNAITLLLLPPCHLVERTGRTQPGVHRGANAYYRHHDKMTMQHMNFFQGCSKWQVCHCRRCCGWGDFLWWGG